MSAPFPGSAVEDVESCYASSRAMEPVRFTGRSRCPLCKSAEVSVWLRAPDRFHGRSTIYTLLRCRACELVWLPDAPSPAQMSEHYTPDYNRAISKAGEGSPERWRARSRVLCAYKSGGAILDLGCSSGAFLNTLSAKAWRLYGIEMSEDTAAKAKAQCKAQVFVGDILCAPFQCETFDAITCFHVFEHLYEPWAVLRTVMNWLKPGGIFYAVMPNIDSVGARLFRSYWYALELPRHLYHFSPVSLRCLAERCGLQIVSLRTHREMYFEQSLRYVIDEFCRKLACYRTPLASAGPPTLSWRVVRKAFRLTALQAISTMATCFGDGERLEVVFQKPSLSSIPYARMPVPSEFLP